MKMTGPYFGRRTPQMGRTFYVRELRGQLIVSKWPRRRGRPTHPTTIAQNEKFKQANWLTKYASAAVQMTQRAIVEGTQMLPRDLMIAAMYGRGPYIDIPGPQRRYPIAAIQDLSDTLDILGAVPGSVLVRASGLWEVRTPGVAGYVLTAQTPPAPAAWAPQLSAPGSWVQIENKILTSALAIGVNHVIAIPTNVQELELVVYQASTTLGTRTRVRFNGDTAGNYYRQVHGVTSSNGHLRQTIAAGNGIWPFLTTQTPITSLNLVRLQINQNPGLNRVHVTYNGYSGHQTSMQGGCAWLNSPATRISTIEVASDQGEGMAIDTQIITRAIFNP